MRDLPLWTRLLLTVCKLLTGVIVVFAGGTDAYIFATLQVTGSGRNEVITWKESGEAYSQPSWMPAPATYGTSSDCISFKNNARKLSIWSSDYCGENNDRGRVCQYKCSK